MSRCSIFTVLLAQHSKAGKSPFHIWKIWFTGVAMPKAMELVCHICSQWINTMDCNEVPLPLICCRLLSTLHQCSLACVQWMRWMSALFIICCIEGKTLCCVFWRDVFMCFELYQYMSYIYWPCTCSQGTPPKPHYELALPDPPPPSELWSSWCLFTLFEMNLKPPCDYTVQSDGYIYI